MSHKQKVLTPARLFRVLGILTLVLAGCAALSLLTGGRSEGMAQALFRGELTPQQRDILLLIRVPRVIMAALTGGVLGACGVILQALLRNPLAYPHILGISGGAAVGGIVAQLFGFSTILFFGIQLPGGPMTAFVTALITTFFVYRVSCMRGRMEPVSLILVGVIFNSFAAALILFFFAIADMREARGVLYWMVGSLDEINLSLVGWVVAIALAGCLWLLRLTPALNALSQGEEVATSLGVRVDAVRRSAFVGTSVAVGAVVSLCGMIGFVGLIVPHLFRLILGPDHRLLFPASFLGGASFLVVTDFLARNMIFPQQLPVGVLTAFCGGPFFLFLLRKNRGGRIF